MKRLLASFLGVLALGAPAFAHRLDEYLQATIVSVELERVRASMRLIPGVAVSAAVIASVDNNADGVFSPAEQRAYAQHVLRDLSLTVDGHPVTPRLESVGFPSPAEMKEGLGEIHIEFAAELPAGGTQRTLILENRHQPAMSVYLMNCLAPQDPAIHLIAQSRNETQSYYRINYAQSELQQDSSFARGWRQLGADLSHFAGVPNMFRLGMRHIAEGTDHLLFLLALLLPAPLIAVRARWARSGAVRESLMQIVRVVSAFTVGHSITLALGASGLVSLPSRAVEVLIAFSILTSAVHALRPIFPGREPMIAASFGLIHGLAFATTLQSLGVGAWQRLASILGFNLGIEAMQLLVVAAILPSLLILSRTPQYAALRLAGALFAGVAALGWIIERLFELPTPTDRVTNRLAQSAGWIAVLLFAISVVLWLWHSVRTASASGSAFWLKELCNTTEEPSPAFTGAPADNTP